MRHPVFLFEQVYHVGTLNIDERGCQFAHSYEGSCLSVSNCPWAWLKIARLGGQPLHRLSREGFRPGVFLDGLGVRNDPALLAVCKTWAVAEELAVENKLWRAWLEDEWGDRRYLLCATKGEAQDEADVPDEVDTVSVLVGTPRLAALEMQGDLDVVDVTDLVIQAWAEAVIVKQRGQPLDGVWWNETFAPERLSAPRGALFTSRLASFKAEAIDWSACPEPLEAPKAQRRLPLVRSETPTGPAPR